MDVSLGRIVHYTLNEGDVTLINHKRSKTGASGNSVRAGDVFPAIVARIFDGSPHGCVNLQVLLDGEDSHWATSRYQVEDGTTELAAWQGRWSWPPRA